MVFYTCHTSTCTCTPILIIWFIANCKVLHYYPCAMYGLNCGHIVCNPFTKQTNETTKSTIPMTFTEFPNQFHLFFQLSFLISHHFCSYSHFVCKSYNRCAYRLITYQRITNNNAHFRSLIAYIKTISLFIPNERTQM